jgi:hypothetical protein
MSIHKPRWFAEDRLPASAIWRASWRSWRYTPEATTWAKIKNRAYTQAEFFEGRAFRVGM